LSLCLTKKGKFLCHNSGMVHRFLETCKINTSIQVQIVLRIRIRRIVGLLDPAPLVRGTDPDLDPHQNAMDPQHWVQKICVADPKQKYRIQFRIRIRPAVSFKSGSGSKTGQNFLFLH
jgi:hypothetical protein